MNKQDLRKLIRESIESDSNIYITKDIDVDVYSNKIDSSGDFAETNGDYFSNDSKATIYWALEMEKRSYGIESIYPVIKKIELNLEIWREGADEYERIKKVIDNISVKNGDFIENFTLIIDDSGENNGQMFPTSLEINEMNNQNKKITIFFDMP
jgi:hypothetical protein